MSKEWTSGMTAGSEVWEGRREKTKVTKRTKSEEVAGRNNFGFEIAQELERSEGQLDGATGSRWEVS